MDAFVLSVPTAQTIMTLGGAISLSAFSVAMVLSSQSSDRSPQGPIILRPRQLTHS